MRSQSGVYNCTLEHSIGSGSAPRFIVTRSAVVTINVQLPSPNASVSASFSTMAPTATAVSMTPSFSTFSPFVTPTSTGVMITPSPSPGAPLITACSAMTVMNFTGPVLRQIPVTAGDTICLACLINNTQLLFPSITWRNNGEIIANNDPFSQVNANGTLLVRIPVDVRGLFEFTCENPITGQYVINLFISGPTTSSFIFISTTAIESTTSVIESSTFAVPSPNASVSASFSTMAPTATAVSMTPSSSTFPPFVTPTSTGVVITPSPSPGTTTLTVNSTTPGIESTTPVIESTTPVLSPSITPAPSPTPTPEIPHLDFINLPNPIKLRAGDDITSGAISIGGAGFPTFNSGAQTLVYVGSNGLISFRSRINPFTPSLFPTTNFVRNGFVVAPFWSDVDARIAGCIQYQVFNPVSDNATISDVSSYISQATNRSFSGVWMLVAEWRDVHPYPHGSHNPFQLDSNQEAIINSTNTFQGIIITDGMLSYAVFVYQCDLLQWSGLNNRHAVIGYNMNGQFMNHPLSGIPQVSDVDCMNSPGTSWSTLVYQIGDLEGELQRSRAECVRRFDVDSAIYSDQVLTLFGDIILPRCPCTLFQASINPLWRFFSQTNFQGTCFLRRFRGLPNRICCYNSLFGLFGPRITQGPNAGGLVIQQSDLDFHRTCCLNSDLCFMYRQRRPINPICSSFTFFFSWFWGDPHINTLDGRMYTFNGLGEYTLVQLGDQFELQGRTEPVNTNTTATQFSACAMASPINGTKIQIEIDNNSLRVRVDGNDVTDTLNNTAMNNTDISSSNATVIERPSNTSVTVTFASGIRIEVSIRVGLLSFVVILPEEFRTQARGLMGNFDGNSTNEFVFRDGTMIPDNSSDRQIHNFGQSWQILVGDTLFTYPVGMSTRDFASPSHMPVFLDELSADAIADARRVCGNDSQCIYDFSQTGNEELAMDTMTTNQENEMNQIMADNDPPVLNGSDTFTITIGQPSIYQFVATDTNNFTITVMGGIGELTQDGDSYSLTVHVNDTSLNTTVSFLAMDVLNASSLLDPQVLICACQNGGNCTLDGIIGQDADPLIMDCICNEAYSGRFCEEDVDACVEQFCFEGVLCTDNPAPQIGATCRSCPSGLQGDGRNCIDIDECGNGAHNCQQECINIERSFMCGCRMGFEFEMNNMTHCRDINECSINSDNCDQLCTNTEGGFNCSCNDGFILQSDMRSCIVDPDRNCSVDNVCEQQCVRNINPSTNMSVEVCSCMGGFTLDSNMINCSDVNECSSNTTNPCTQNCINSVGSFVCSCTSGYRLGSDGFTCGDINECVEAAMGNQQICNMTQSCENTVGSFRCVCPGGTELNMQGMCVAQPVLTTSSSITPVSTPTPSSTIARISSTALPTTTPTITTPTDTPTITTPTVPTGIDQNQVAVVLRGVTVATFRDSERQQFQKAAADSLNLYCGSNRDRCRLPATRKRQSTTVLASGVTITSTMDTSSGLRVNLYVQGSTGLIPQQDVLSAIRSNTAQFQNAGFDVASVEPVNQSTDELSTGAIVGIVIAVMVIALVVVVVLLTVICCWWMRQRKNQHGKYSFAKSTNLENEYIASGEVVIHNEAYDSSARQEKDYVSLSSVTLKNAVVDQGASDSDED